MYLSRVDFYSGAFERLKRERGWYKATTEYAAHTLLKEMLGNDLGVWRLMPRNEKRYALVTSDDDLELRFKERGLMLAEQGSVIDGIKGVRGRRLEPALLTKGLVVGFGAHVIPVVRHEGREEDAFNRRRGATRQEAYSNWIADEFRKMGGRLIGSCALDFFSAERMTRRTQQKPRRFVEFTRPVAEMFGRVEITDGKAFVDGFTRGVGRHRSFGYGMVSISVRTGQ